MNERMDLQKPLKTLKKLNCLIGCYREQGELLSATTKVLLEAGDYHGVVLLVEDRQGKLEHCHVTGFAVDESKLANHLIARYPVACLRRVEEGKGAVLHEHGDHSCPDCPVMEMDVCVRRSMNLCLAHAGRRFGYLMLFLKEGADWTSEAQFVPEIGSVISHALYTLAVESDLREQLVKVKSAKAEVEAASRAKSEFLNLVSHEIRSPLNGIIGMSEYLRQLQLSGDVGKCMDVISRSAELLLEMLNQILDFNRMEAGRFQLKREAVHLSEALTAFAESQRKRFELKDLSFVVKNQLPKQIYCMDWLRFQQVILNLFSNAIKFTDAGGRVSLEAAEIAPGLLSFAVEDTGEGIDLNINNQLFQPFIQASGQKKTGAGGTGLGLSICRKIVELHGGSISVESEPGKGARFSFTLKAAAMEL
jgi:signal transduction histidine kinase